MHHGEHEPPELVELERLISAFGDSMELQVLCEVSAGTRSFPVYAIALGKPIRELEQTIQAAANGQKAELQDRLKALKSEQQAHEQAAKSAQAEGDALYWPIYNLDLKNPNAKTGLEHADPKDLIAAMRSHEVEVMRLLGEIEVLVRAVGAE